MNYTDTQLKQALAKMLPNLIKCTHSITEKGYEYCYLTWLGKTNPFECECRDTELLHLCWLVEETLNEINSADYAELLRPISANYKLLYHASWQQRVEALAEVKGIEV